MNQDEKIIFHNLELIKEESISPNCMSKEIITVNNANFEKLSLYEMQKSALEWKWYEFSWFLEEKKYRKLIYNNSVPVYKIPK